MLRSTLVVAASLCAAALRAQCLVAAGAPVALAPTTLSWPASDEGISAPLPLGFAFPLGAGTFTHVAIESNGVAYLTNGAPPAGTSMFGIQNMAGAAGAAPRIAAYWTDLEGVSATWSVLMDTTVPGQASITWVDVNEFLQPGAFTVQSILYATGVVETTLSPGLAPHSGHVTVGVAAANGLVGASADLSAGATSAIASLYEDFFAPAPIDIANSTTAFVPSAGGLHAATTCTASPPASHTAYGAGCYDIAASFYELFAPASFDLTATGMTMLLTPGGYTMQAAVAAFVPPPASATVLALGDDSDAPVALTTPFPYPGGTTSALVVCSNGFVSAGPGNYPSFLPDVQELLNSAAPCWRGAWHDFYPPGGGQVKAHTVGSVTCITWDGVFDFGTTTPETFQMQFDASNGSVHVLWTALTGSGNSYLVGYSPGTALDPGACDLSAALPATFSTAAADTLALALAASPSPISTPSAGTTVTFTMANMPAFAPGLYVGLAIFSGGASSAPGLDLAALGAPGCFAHVATLDVTLAMLGASPTQTVAIDVPAGVPPGTTVFAQAAALFPPNALPNGENAFGLVTSNGLSIFISTH